MFNHIKDLIRRRATSRATDVGINNDDSSRISISAPSLTSPEPVPDDPSTPIHVQRANTNGPKFQFMSDLHLERTAYAAFNIPSKAPYLILAGDIGRFADRTHLFAFLEEQCQKFERVLYVPGNHEFYGTSRPEGLRAAGEIETRLEGRLTVMHRTRMDFATENGNVVVLGCTMHSHIPDDTQGLTSDFARISDWTVADHNAEHLRDVCWLEDSLNEIHSSDPDARVIIATHYAPEFKRTNHPRLRDSKVKYCFSSHTLEAAQSWKGIGQVSHWIFGHTHYNAWFQVRGIVIVSNTPWDHECRRRFDAESTI
ncbi:ser thr protein phosphatase [Teratosphaeria destructans]|uniref:Ser thr protein phosphatase n=1 Tax=Teratosphaeria destructans TaxID=418781 RepID=A0A9W7T2C5_9PEZI|nr:ser thr protein phosphatase [Teratosphaeria destructans]